MGVSVQGVAVAACSGLDYAVEVNLLEGHEVLAGEFLLFGSAGVEGVLGWGAVLAALNAPRAEVGAVGAELEGGFLSEETELSDYAQATALLASAAGVGDEAETLDEQGLVGLDALDGGVGHVQHGRGQAIGRRRCWVHRREGHRC